MREMLPTPGVALTVNGKTPVVQFRCAGMGSICCNINLTIRVIALSKRYLETARIAEMLCLGNGKENHSYNRTD